LSADKFSTHSREAIEAWTLATIPRALAYARSLLRDRGRSEDVVEGILA
jgi:DNA-directed RNA polymerase specialized sigma24 family protein